MTLAASKEVLLEIYHLATLIKQADTAMYAAKEATSKALGTGLSQGVFLNQIEVRHDALGAPGLALSGAALERMHGMGGTRMLLSLSHEGDMAVAFVVMQ